MIPIIPSEAVAPTTFVPSYPGQTESIVWGESIRAETNSFRPGNPLGRIFGVPGDWGSSGYINTQLAYCRTNNMIPFLSSKVTGTDWYAAAAGSDDVHLNLILDRIAAHVTAGGKKPLFSLHHEPDGAGGDDPAGAPAHIAMNEYFRGLITSRGLTEYLSLGPTFTGWGFRHSYIGTDRDPQIWVLVDNPYDWIGADLYSGVDGSVVTYGGTGIDINGDVQVGNPDRALTLCAERGGLDLWVPEWGVEWDYNPSGVVEFHTWIQNNSDVVKGVIYYNRSLDPTAHWQFGKEGRPDAREDQWLAYNTALNGV